MCTTAIFILAFYLGFQHWNLMAPMQRASQEVKDAQMFREKMGSVSEWMGRVKLPRELKSKIRAYYAEVESSPVHAIIYNASHSWQSSTVDSAPMHAHISSCAVQTLPMQPSLLSVCDWVVIALLAFV